MQASPENHRIFKRAMPIMVSALITLVLGGMIGIGYLVTLMGASPPPPLAWTPPFFAKHWFLLIMGFTLALISAELLVLLSAEWSKRPAPRPLILAFIATLWASIASYLLVSPGVGLLLSAAAAAIVLYHVKRALLSRSWIGLPPTHYNYLLATTLVLTIALALTGGLSHLKLLPPPPIDVAVASILLPVGAIIAVESRDIPLLMGVPPTRAFVENRRRLRNRALAGYVLSIAGILGVAVGSPTAMTLGGLLLIAGGLVSASSVGLMGLLEKNSGGVPEKFKRHTRLHISLSYAWFLIAGVIAVAEGTVGGLPLARDMIVHSLTLGFMFNVIFGVDAVLLYGHAGIPIHKAPPPTLIPTVLLNASLVLRLVHDTLGITGLALASGPLAGLAIVFFYARNMRHMRKLLKQAAPHTGKAPSHTLPHQRPEAPATPTAS